MLDVSGSMKKEGRLGQLTKSLQYPAGADNSITGRFSQLNSRECYLAGYWLGKSLFGEPQLVVTDLAALDEALADREKSEAMAETLEAPRTIAKSNVGKYFSPKQEAALTALTVAIKNLHQEWMLLKAPAFDGKCLCCGTSGDRIPA